MFALIYDILISLIGILYNSILLTIPIFLISVPAVKLRDYIKKRYNLEWIYATFATILVICLILGFLIYFYFVITTPEVFNIKYPPGVETNIWEELSRSILFSLGVLIRRILVAIIFSLIIFPFAFVGSFAVDIFAKKVLQNEYAALAFASFICCFLFFIISIIFDFLIPGLYYVFFYL